MKTEATNGKIDMAPLVEARKWKCKMMGAKRRKRGQSLVLTPFPKGHRFQSWLSRPFPTLPSLEPCFSFEDVGLLELV